MTGFGEFLVDLAGKLMRVRVERLLVPLIGSIAEHDALITGSKVLFLLISMDSIGNVDILGLNNLDNVTLSTVKALLPRVVSNSFAGVPGNLFEIDLLLGDASLTHQAEHLGFDGALHSHFSVGVDSKAGIKDGIGNLITKFIRVTFSDRFGGEIDVIFFCSFH